MASQLPRITILGSLNIDLVSYVSHHPLPGETMTADSFSVSPGGKGANQAVACAKLSRSRSSAGAASADENATAHVAMVGTVGADSYGSLLRDNMAAHGVDVQGVEVGKELKTGVALIVVDAPTGQNRIILSPEANHALQPAHIEGSHFGTRLGAPLPDLLIMQLEIPLATVVQALESARAAGVAVLLNPAPADANLPHSSLNGLAHLVMNETEAALLAGCDVSELDTAAGLDRVGRMFVEQRGVHNVLITLGGRGVYFTTSKGVTGQLPAEKATVVDTTAAGDTFVGQYALEVVAAKEGEFDIEMAVKKANHAAAKTVEKKGAQVSIPWRDELE